MGLNLVEGIAWDCHQAAANTKVWYLKYLKYLAAWKTIAQHCTTFPTRRAKASISKHPPSWLTQDHQWPQLIQPQTSSPSWHCVLRHACGTLVGQGGHFEIDTNSIQFHPILSILACEIPQLPKDVWWLAWPIAAWMRQGLRPSWLAARRGESQITCNCRAALACGRMWRTADEKGWYSIKADEQQ